MVRLDQAGRAMNGFQRHGIDHLSASSINLFTNAPDVWVMQYLFGKRTPAGPAMWRGIAVEDGVVAALAGDALEDATLMAEDLFDRKIMIGDEASAKERAMIKPMIEQAVDALAPYGKPVFSDDGSQVKISITAKGDGWEIPVIGFLDLVYPEHGLVIDLKTTNRIPSQMSAEHQLQRAIYSGAMGNSAVKFLYASPKKTAMLEDGDVAETLARAKVQITRMEAFLRKLDAEEAKAIVPTNFNSFYWRGAEDLRKEFYGV